MAETQRAQATAPSQPPSRGADYSTQRLSRKYCFSDPNMDLFFLGALGWGPAGGLSPGEAFHAAQQITDGDVDSWVSAFEQQGITLTSQADRWLERGSERASGETRLKAFSCYRLAWQFAAPGEQFGKLYRTHEKLFDQAMEELKLGAVKFTVDYAGGKLPGHFFRSSDASMPTVLVVGGADTCHEDRFLSQGRFLLQRGYSVALVDLPGQGHTQEQDLYWEPETERPIAAVVDKLISSFGVEPKRLAFVGMSLGGYFACRAAAHEKRLGAVVATTPLWRPGELFIQAGGPNLLLDDADKKPTPAKANMRVLMWKAGVTASRQMKNRWEGVKADPALVDVPFLSVLGGQEGTLWKEQATEWHEKIPSEKKEFLFLDAESGADAHCQGNNPLRLAQEIDLWLRKVL
jgi:pimeloyl-ACP methyl ester carboxylesterase